MPMSPHHSLVQIFIILITLPVVFCFPQVDLRLEQTVGDNQLATGDLYVSNIDVDKYPAPAPFLADILKQSEIQRFLQWINPPEPPKCDNGLFAFCCNWPAPNPNIGIWRPPHVDPKEVVKRRRKCGKWNKDRPGCLIPENNFCCDCKDVNEIAYNCYNPFYRDDIRFQGKPEPRPSPLGHPIENDRPAPQELDLDESKGFNRNPQGEASEENDRIERRTVVPSATNEIRSRTSNTSGAGEIGRTGVDTQLLRALKTAQPQAANDGDDPDGTGKDVELMRAWKRAQPAVPDGDDPDGTGEDVEIMRAWKRAQPAVPDGGDTERAGADAQLLRAWKRVQPTVPDGDDTKKAGADTQLLRAWKRTPQPTTADSDDMARAGTKDAQQSIKLVWQRAQPEVSAADAADYNSERIVPNAQLFASWKSSQSWNGEDGESERVDHYDDGPTTTVGNPRDNDPAMCKKKYLNDLGIFS